MRMSERDDKIERKENKTLNGKINKHLSSSTWNSCLGSSTMRIVETFSMLNNLY